MFEEPVMCSDGVARPLLLEHPRVDGIINLGVPTPLEAAQEIEAAARAVAAAPDERAKEERTGELLAAALRFAASCGWREP